MEPAQRSIKIDRRFLPSSVCSSAVRALCCPLLCSYFYFVFEIFWFLQQLMLGFLFDLQDICVGYLLVTHHMLHSVAC